MLRAVREAYFHKQPAATNYVRYDALGMLLALGNAGALHASRGSWNGFQFGGLIVRRRRRAAGRPRASGGGAPGERRRAWTSRG